MTSKVFDCCTVTFIRRNLWLGMLHTLSPQPVYLVGICIVKLVAQAVGWKWDYLVVLQLVFKPKSPWLWKPQFRIYLIFIPIKPLSDLSYLVEEGISIPEVQKHQEWNISPVDKGDHSEQLCIDLQSPFPLRGQVDTSHANKMPPEADIDTRSHHCGGQAFSLCSPDAHHKLVKNMEKDDSSDHIPFFSISLNISACGFFTAPNSLQYGVQLCTATLLYSDIPLYVTVIGLIWLTQSDHVLHWHSQSPEEELLSRFSSDIALMHEHHGHQMCAVDHNYWPLFRRLCCKWQAHGVYCTCRRLIYIYVFQSSSGCGIYVYKKVCVRWRRWWVDGLTNHWNIS